jgi:dUTP pyrophosphatase
MKMDGLNSQPTREDVLQPLQAPPRDDGVLLVYYDSQALECAAEPIRPLAKGNAAMDLRAKIGFTLWPFQIRKIPTGVHTEPLSQVMSVQVTDVGILSLEVGFFLKVEERSGLALKGIRIAGGVVDPNYRGEWSIIIQNLSFWPRRFKAGDRIAQFVALPYISPVLVRVNKLDDLSPTDRGEKGYGSSGVT